MILAGTPDVALGALSRTTPDPRLASLTALMARTQGALRVGQALSRFGARDATCLKALAGAQRFGRARQSEDLLLQLSGTPQPSAVVLEQGAQRTDILTRDYRVTGATVQGPALALKIAVTPDALSNSNAATIASGGVEPQALYRCPGQKTREPEPEDPSLPQKQPGLPEPADPDTSGNRLEDSVSAYLAAGSTAPNAVKVRCPGRQPRPSRSIRCTGTRRDDGTTYRYTIKVNFNKSGGIKSIDIDSPDDKTKTIVS